MNVVPSYLVETLHGIIHSNAYLYLERVVPLSLVEALV